MLIVALFVIFYRQTLFASADTAYVLAYSIIMLTTDLHSPQVDLLLSFGPRLFNWKKTHFVTTVENVFYQIPPLFSVDVGEEQNDKGTVY